MCWTVSRILLHFCSWDQCIFTVPPQGLACVPGPFFPLQFFRLLTRWYKCLDRQPWFEILFLLPLPCCLCCPCISEARLWVTGDSGSQHAFPIIGQHQLRTSCSVLSCVGLTRTISLQYDTWASTHAPHHLILFERVAVSIPDVSNIPSCRHSPVAVWSTSDLLVLSGEPCCICAGCLFLKGHFLVRIPSKGDQAREQPPPRLLCAHFTWKRN